MNQDYVLRYQSKYNVEKVRSDTITVADKPLVNGDRLTLLVWNIFKQKRVESFDFLAQYMTEADLILLQEVQSTVHFLKLITQHQKIADQVPAYLFNHIYVGVMTIANQLPYSVIPFKEREPFIRVPKSALITKYLLNDKGQVLLVANIHAINFSLGVKIYQQQIRILLNQIKHHQGPVILGGDFNSWSRKRLSILFHLIRNIGLKAVTFSADLRKTFMGKPLDFVFYRGLKIEHANIIHTKSSDHNPILVKFLIK